MGLVMQRIFPHVGSDSTECGVLQEPRPGQQRMHSRRVPSQGMPPSDTSRCTLMPRGTFVRPCPRPVVLKEDGALAGHEAEKAIPHLNSRPR